MRILFYYYMGGGGALSNIILLLRAVARCHPEDTIQVVTSPLTPFDALEQVPNIRIRRVCATGHSEVDRLLLGVFLVPRIVREAKTDILWSLNHGPYVNTGVPSVLSVHSAFQVFPWEVSRYHPASAWHLALIRHFFRRSLRVSNAVIVQTPTMAGYVRRLRGAPSAICVAPKAVEGDADVRSEPLPQSLRIALAGGLGEKAFTFLYVATWSPHKNHITLLKAFSELARRKVQARVVLTVTPEEILAAGWPDTRFLLEEGYVVLAGWVEKPYLRALYAACDACLMPSMLESLSSANIEAMQWKRPQIAADLPYGHDVCGPAAIYAPAEDEHEWVRQIKRLMGDPVLRAELVDAGPARMTQFPTSWDDASEIVHCFLESVLRAVDTHSIVPTPRPRDRIDT